jgi:hypothetical protein
MKKYLFFLFFIYTFFSGFTQSKFILSDNGNRIKEVAVSNSVVFYGMDFSLMRLTDAKKIDLEEKSDLDRFFPGWISLFEKLDYVKEVKRYLRKSDFSYSPASVQSRYKFVPKDWVILDDYSINYDTLISVVKDYKLKEKEGLGFVIIIENFNKRQERGTMYMTFFDIAKKEVLWSTQVWGEPGGFGMTKYWLSTVFYGFGKYINYYNKMTRLALKNKLD